MSVSASVFFSSRRRHTRYWRDWSSDVCSSDLDAPSKDIARWDHLLSPNPPSTPLLRGAFRYGGPIHETGYPRNDALSAPDRSGERGGGEEGRTRWCPVHLKKKIYEYLYQLDTP